MSKSELSEIYDIVCRISGVGSTLHVNTFNEIKTRLLIIEKDVIEKNRQQEEREKRVNEILEVIVALAQLNYDEKAIISDKLDHFDALALGVNMLGEELQSSTISLNEKEILLKEIHHRVKNNLQVISSLLNLQSEYIKDPYSLEKFKESQNRVRSMALVHEKLYASKNLSKINFSEYIETFIEMVNYSYNISGDRIKLHLNMKIDKNFLKIDTAIPCALILNELISNSFKYAFPDHRSGNIYLNFNKSEDNVYTFEVADDGIGMPEIKDIQAITSLGLQLVFMLVKQIGGTINLLNKPQTRFVIKFKEE